MALAYLVHGCTLISKGDMCVAYQVPSSVFDMFLIGYYY